MTAVITPTGRISSLAVASAISSNIAPTANEEGNRYRASGRTTNLTKCGAMSPTNPIVPVNATTDAVMSETTTRDLSLCESGSVPRLMAVSSSVDSMFNVPPWDMRIKVPKETSEKSNGISAQRNAPRFPSPHM